MDLTLNSNFIDLDLTCLEIVNGGSGNVADFASMAGGVYTAVIGLGSAGYLGAGAVAVCSAPVVAGSAAVLGVVCAGYGVYAYFR